MKREAYTAIVGEFLIGLVVDVGTFIKSHQILCLSVVVTWLLHRICNRRYNIIRDLHDVGFDDVKKGKWHHRHSVRHPSDLPPVFPNGWFPLIESHDLAVGKVKAVTALGQEFAIFRGQGGKAYILDAYCPHLGAHLAIGGLVSGECLECPFHGWRFKGSDGACALIPYQNRAPEVAQAKTWPSCEVNGLVMVWYHAEGDKPTWMPVVIPEVENGTWLYRGRTQHTVRCHIQDINENGADSSHLKHIHSYSTFAGRDLQSAATSAWNFFHHSWESDWAADTNGNPHLANIQLKHSASVWGRKIPLFNLKLSTRQVGPSLVYIHFEASVGSVMYVQYVTPEGPLRQRLCQVMYAPKSVPQLVVNLLLMADVVMLERDIMIWNHKQLLRKPVLVSADCLIAKYRRWYSQFYSEHSPKLRDVMSTSLDW